MSRQHKVGSGHLNAPLWGALALLLVAAPTTASSAGVLDPAMEKNIRGFLATYCLECHGPEKQKGDRRFDQLELPATHFDTVVELQDAIDLLTLGDMPPSDADHQPKPAEVTEMIAQLTKLVQDGHATLTSTGGQTVLRRINRREYLNTIGDLFGIEMKMFDPTTNFPRDLVVQHMDNIGDALKTSGYLLTQYLDAADKVVEKAFSQPERPETQTWRFDGDFQQQSELRHSHGKVHNFSYLCLYETINSDKHEGAYGPLLNFAQGVPADGSYEIRVKAEAKFRKHEYAPDHFGTDPSMPFQLSIVAGTLDYIFHSGRSDERIV